MPRIPTYLAQGNAAVANYPRVLNAPADVGDQAITQGLGELGSAAAQTSAFLDNVRRMQQQEDEKLDLARAEADVKTKMADATIGLKAAGTSPDVYEAALGEKTRQIMQDTVETLKYKDSAPRFIRSVAPFLTEQGIHAKYDAFAMKNAELEVGTDMEIDRQANLAVSAQTQEDRDAAVETAMGLAQNAYVKHIYSKDKMVHQIDQVRTKTEVGRIETALRDPSISEEVLTKLESGTASKYLPAQMQYTMAAQYTDRLDKKQRQQEADENRLATERAQEAKQLYQSQYNDIFQRAINPQPGQAPATYDEAASLARRWGSTMTPEDQARLVTAIGKPVKDTPSDPETLARFTADLMGVQPRATERDLAQAYDAHANGGKGLNAADYSRLLAHRTSRVESIRKEGESDFDREMQRAKVELQTRIGVPPFLNSYTHDQQKRLSAAMEEFNRRTLPERQADRQGAPPERPEAVLKDMIPRYQAGVTAELVLQEDQLKKLIDPRWPNIKALNEAYDKGQVTPGVYESQVAIWGKIFPLVKERLLMALPAEEARLTGQKPKTGAPTKSPTIKSPGLK